MAVREKPLLIYDGDCNFCRRWIARWQNFTQHRVDYAPYQQVAGEFPQIPLDKFEASVQLVETNGSISRGAEAVYRTLTYSKGKSVFYWMYQYVPGFKQASEWFYSLVAKNRHIFSFLTRFFWGNDILPPMFSISSWLFRRVLGAIYLIAFLSLAVQIVGLVGKGGILPAKLFLDAISHRIGAEGFWFLPTIFWFNSSDLFLQAACWIGVLLSAILVIGFAEGPILFLLWVLYLSFYTICGDFLSFQWDILLLEAGFLAIFLAPLDSWSNKIVSVARPSEPSRIVIWLFRWLLFRLMFFSGVVKLVSGDPAWRNLTALTVHYETQPLPTWIGWYFHQLPVGFQKLSTVTMFVMELAVPFLIFMPRRLRLIGAGLITLFQLLIIATGNYCFFNLLTIAFCILLVDDRSWPWRGFKKKEPETKTETQVWTKWVTVPLCAFILVISTIQFGQLFRVSIPWPVAIRALYQWTAQFQIVNSYGLFQVMTMKRPEIIIEGSRDGKNWLAYEFKYKPGDVKAKPKFNQPHQPRLDWQMWFAALSRYDQNPWFINFCIRLLEGSPDVLKLLKTNPFPEAPPTFIRATVYDYHFTNPEILKNEKAWWWREATRLYCPTLSLEKVKK